MIEENICCGDVSAPEDTLYGSYLGNANEISDLQDLLLDGQDSGEDGSVTACTSADVAHTGCEAATQTYLKVDRLHYGILIGMGYGNMCSLMAFIMHGTGYGNVYSF